MRIKDEIIKEFADKGVSVRWFPERNYKDFYARVWNKEYEYALNYGKDHVRGCEAVMSGRTNEVYESCEALVAHCKRFADQTAERSCDPYEYDMLYIEYGEKLIMQKISVKSKEVTSEYIQKLINKNEKAYNGAYGDFALRMQRLLKTKGIETFNIYPTTYGIGVWRIYNFKLDEDIQSVEDILREYDVEYSNELSDKAWVLRFKINKKAYNLAKIPA